MIQNLVLVVLSEPHFEAFLEIDGFVLIFF